jgi:hypothetical protein
MKRHRRYREHIGVNTFSVSSTHADERIHDFLKGWGTIANDGKSILWDTYRPATKKQRDKLDRYWKKNPPFIFPVIKNMHSTSLIDEIVSVQPMMNPPSKDL